MTDHEAAALKIVQRFEYVTKETLPRFLNLYSPCPWCPVGPPRKERREFIAFVPEVSQVVAQSTLESLLRRGLVRKIWHNGAARYLKVDPAAEVSPVDAGHAEGQ